MEIESVLCGWPFLRKMKTGRVYYDFLKDRAGAFISGKCLHWKGRQRGGDEKVREPSPLLCRRRRKGTCKPQERSRGKHGLKQRGAEFAVLKAGGTGEKHLSERSKLTEGLSLAERRSSRKTWLLKGFFFSSLHCTLQFAKCFSICYFTLTSGL